MAVIVPERPDTGKAEWGVKQVSAGWAVDLDAGHLVDAMTRAALTHHRDAIMSGVRPDGGGPQAPLGKKALEDPDRDSPFRAFKSGELADGLRRTEIRSTGKTATSTLLPPTSRTVYVAKERQRGINLLTGAGAAGKVATDAAQRMALAMAEGRRIDTEPGEVAAKDVKP